MQRKFFRFVAFSFTVGALLIPFVISVLAAQTDIPGPSGSGKFGTQVLVLPNGNFVVTDPFYDAPGPITDTGAVYLYDGATLAIISTLTGSTVNDKIGSGGITVLANGNFVVDSSIWNNGAATKAGAVTWGSASAGVSGTVSVSNSLIGGTSNDQIGNYGVTALTNGNYVVASPNWRNNAPFAVDAGAATWGNGTIGTVGVVSVTNSLVGGSFSDAVSSVGVSALTNGNYVVGSLNWDSPLATNVGAVTWGNGTIGTAGLVSVTNSLVGGRQDDKIGGFTKATALPNGNYVVRSYLWDNPAPVIANVGAVTWGNGAIGTVGLVSKTNSLIGGRTNDSVGEPQLTVLTNGNYVVSSPDWDDPTGPIGDVGAVTWGNGTIGTVGLVSKTNSLVGGRTGDAVGDGNFGYVTALTNGNYVVPSYHWDNPSPVIIDVGAVTWGNGVVGTFGLVSVTNSLIGGSANDHVGVGDFSGGLVPLTNGNFVVSSPDWDKPAPLTADVGAATWGNGTGGTIGLVTSSNSLIGGTASDHVGKKFTALTNGNYVIGSEDWDNPSPVKIDVGAATWGNGVGGTVGPVTSTNSLVGGTADDLVGVGVVPLTNGNYVVASTIWNNPLPFKARVGAATWGNGTGGTVGLVTITNSLVGGSTSDNVGLDGVTVLANGNYVVNSDGWNNPSPSTTDAGAVTWGNGAGGTVGLVTSSNSLIGGTAFDSLSGAVPLANGHYVVESISWSNPSGPVIDARAVTLGNGNIGTVGLVSTTNSILGTAPHGTSGFSFDYTRSRLFVGRAASNIVSVLDCPFCSNTKVFLPLVMR